EHSENNGDPEHTAVTLPASTRTRTGPRQSRRPEAARSATSTTRRSPGETSAAPRRARAPAGAARHAPARTLPGMSRPARTGRRRQARSPDGRGPDRPSSAAHRSPFLLVGGLQLALDDWTAPTHRARGG